MPQPASGRRQTSAAKRVAIVQSSYIPWKGYFDLINLVDEFILFDDRQYTRRDWRNRNRIKSSQGVQWLSIPVRVKGQFTQRIDETRVADPGWGTAHWRTIAQCYGSAPHFEYYRESLEAIYRDPGSDRLSKVNRRFLDAICSVLGITTPITWSTDYEGRGSKTERLVSLCQAAGATAYLSGPSARAYIDPAVFAAAGVELTYMDYSGYLEYPQLYPPFEHSVSALDLIFMTGPDAPRYLKSFASVAA